MTYRPPGSQQTFFFIDIRLPSNIISSMSSLFTKQTEQSRQSIALNLWTEQPAGTQVHGQSLHHDYWSQKETMQLFCDYILILFLQLNKGDEGYLFHVGYKGSRQVGLQSVRHLWMVRKGFLVVDRFMSCVVSSHWGSKLKVSDWTSSQVLYLSH